MNDELILIENKIYEVRGTKVMLDFDLAELYGCLLYTSDAADEL